jgi:LacI family transcriptional regulator
MQSVKSLTIQDIAKRARVSPSTVSRVLNSTAKVAPKTRDLVLSIIAEANYKPNLFAQGLAGGQTRTIGILTQLFGSPFYDVILRGILNGIEGSGYMPIFADGNWVYDQEMSAIQMFLNRRVDGLILLSGATPEEKILEAAAQLPVVVIGRNIKGLENQSLCFDDFQAAYRAVQYLIDAGHRRIAHITGLLQHQDAIERRAGYLQALKDAGIEADPNLIMEGDFTEASGMMAVEMLLMRGKNFSAVFASNDQMAYGVRLGLFRRGLRVPDDVSIVGFDDQGPSAYMIPPLTTVRRVPIEIGETAIRAMIRLMKGEKIALEAIESTLAIRDSVARRY